MLYLDLWQNCIGRNDKIVLVLNELWENSNFELNFGKHLVLLLSINKDVFLVFSAMSNCNYF